AWGAGPPPWGGRRRRAPRTPLARTGRRVARDARRGRGDAPLAGCPPAAARGPRVARDARPRHDRVSLGLEPPVARGALRGRGRGRVQGGDVAGGAKR